MPVEVFPSDWNTLDHSGPNGWVSVIAALCWLGNALRRTKVSVPKPKEDWEDMVKDVLHMLGGLVAFRRARK